MRMNRGFNVVCACKCPDVECNDFALQYNEAIYGFKAVKTFSKTFKNKTNLRSPLRLRFILKPTFLTYLPPLPPTRIMVISDIFLTNLSNTLGAAAVFLIVAYQFVEVNAKREAEHVARNGGEREEVESS